MGLTSQLFDIFFHQAG